MDEWQKDFWEVVESVTVGIETFFQDVTRTFEEVHTEIVTDIEQFLQEIIPIEVEDFFSGDFPFSEFDNSTDFILTPKIDPDPNTHPACIGCQNYHGYIYGGNLLVCGYHPYGWQDTNCPDWEGEK
ncbi:hypothetical protein V0288_13765 [Pannus brasiliensis CCIBt3594]|uniref:Uncharacterized protein n=1 Tax=Pannus brasiliensis CCIBt3594 TaxID=1427578 RepID=A0AAW9QTJ7_9CHRO